MKIEIWSDIICPFCYIGKRKLEEALKISGMENVAKIEFKSFELNPVSSRNVNKDDIHEILSQKYGMSIEEAKLTTASITRNANEAGLDFNYANVKPTNTFDAHRLTHYAKTHGKMVEFTEELMKNYFIDNLVISDEDVLLNAAVKIGLDRKETKAILDSEKFSLEVKEDEKKAMELNITGVPFFLIDDKKSISGAQSVEYFIETLKNV